jgi:hypothetical protein
MKSPISIRFLLLITAVYTLAASAQALQSKHQEFSRSKEKALRVILEVSFGNISIERGERDRIATVDYDEEEESKHKLYVSYDITDDTGTLYIKLKGSTHFWGDDEDRGDHHRQLDIKLSDAIPISFEIELGAGSGDIDLTDLQVKDLNVSTGASSVNMKCNKPNPINANDISIESGVSKFTATDLSNLNFSKLKFSGGIGSYKLDFNGKLKQSAEVQIEVGLGSIKIYIPKSIPARLVYDDHWLSSFHIDDDFDKKQNDVYETEDFDNTSKHLIIQMEAGLGSVRVHRK